MVKRGELQRVIATVLEESGLKVDAPSFTIAKDTVQYRVKAQTDLTKLSCGIATPMATVEPLLVELCLQKARMGQPSAKDTVRSRVKVQTDLTKSRCGIATPMAPSEPSVGITLPTMVQLRPWVLRCHY